MELTALTNIITLFSLITHQIYYKRAIKIIQAKSLLRPQRNAEKPNPLRQVTHQQNPLEEPFPFAAFAALKCKCFFPMHSTKNINNNDNKWKTLMLSDPQLVPTTPHPHPHPHPESNGNGSSTLTTIGDSDRLPESESGSPGSSTVNEIKLNNYGKRLCTENKNW